MNTTDSQEMTKSRISGISRFLRVIRFYGTFFQVQVAKSTFLILSDAFQQSTLEKN
jgi:hypothetical protein